MRRFAVVCVLVLILPAVLCGLGQKAPDFVLVSGDEKSVTLATFTDQVVLCFYESRKSAGLNRDFKDALKASNKQTHALEKGVVVLAVADCSASFPLVKGLWEKGLIDKSAQEGFPVYGDWTGKMRDSYGFGKNESNFVIIDRNKTIRYHIAGKITPEETGRIINVIKALVAEQPVI